MKMNIKSIIKHWDNVAHRYDDANSHKLNPHNWRFVEGIKHIPKTSENLRILNLFSRTGNAIPFIKTKISNAEIYGFDVSRNMNGISKKLYPEVKFAFTNLKTIDLADNFIDIIISPETLEHTPHPEKLIKEFYRVLKPGGTLVLSLPPRIADLYQIIWEYTVGGHGDGPRKGLHTWTVKKILRKTNFKLKKHKSILLFPIGPVWFIKLGNKILEYFPFLNNFGVMNFYICSK